jgi:prolyl-tRNA synthetase
VPIRLEIGPKDIAKNETRGVRRDTSVSAQFSLDGIVKTVTDLLEKIQGDMFAAAKQIRDDHLVSVTTFPEFCTKLNQKNMLIAPWCEAVSCEESVKDRSAKSADGEVDEKAPSMGAKTLCIPFEQPVLEKGTKCFACGEEAKSWTVWGRSY